MPEKQKKLAPELFIHKTNPALAKAPAVERSAKASERRSGEKIGNAEQKIGAFLLRLEAVSADERARDRLARRFIDNLLVNEEDIPESYWSQQEQLHRDNGHSVSLTADQKRYLAEQLRDSQRAGIESWTNYLGDPDSDYPSWFKIYAFDGMSKLGVFDKAAGTYKKRSKGTVAPYPQLNPAALAKTYDYVLQNKIEGTESEEGQPDLKTGNFNKVYSYYLLETSATVLTPERAEDVHGEWRQYTDVKELMDAAQGTPWCIAGRKMAEVYLSRPQGEFHLYHLEDPETGKVSQNAAASIRMEKGKVAEISGLKGGSSQYLEDALVPEAMKKVTSLPGGEEYLEAFRDKQLLIAMDRKFQSEPREPFTLEELEFLYEKDRKIKYLDTYEKDPRPAEFKQERSAHVSQLAERYGERAAELIVMSPYEVAENIDEYLHDGDITVDMVFAKLDRDAIECNVNKLLVAGLDPNKLVPELDSITIANELDKLLAAGAHININEVVADLSDLDIAYAIDKLQAAGADIDVGALVGRLDSWTIAYTIDKLQAVGAAIDVEKIVADLKSDPGLAAQVVDKLIAAGAKIDVDALEKRLTSSDVAYALDSLLAAGASPERLAAKLVRRGLIDYIPIIINATDNINGLVEAMGKAGENGHEAIISSIDDLLAAGASIDTIVHNLPKRMIILYQDKLRAYGASIDLESLFSDASDEVTSRYRNFSIEDGFEPEATRERLGE